MKNSNAWRVLVEASKLLTLHRTLILPIILISIVISSLLFISNYLIISPFLIDISLNLYAITSTSSNGLDHTPFQATLHKDIRELATTQCLFFAISFTIFGCMAIATMHVVSQAYIGVSVTLMDLFMHVKRSWRGPMVTQLYVSSLDLSCKLMFMALFGVSLYIIFNGYLVFIALVFILAIFALYFYVELTMVWSLSFVVSIVEEGLHGMVAIRRGKELIKVRRREGIAISFVLVMANVVIFVVYWLLMMGLERSLVMKLVNGLVMANASVVVNMFSACVYVAMYYECRKGSGDEEMVAMKGKFLYGDEDDECVHDHGHDHVEMLDLDD